MAPRPLLLLAAATAGVLALAGCAQSNGATGTAASGTPKPAATASAPAPAPFDTSTPVKIALVRQSGAGDYFTSWGAGAAAQAKASNIELDVTDARNDNAKQASDLAQAITEKPAAIIIDHGLKDTIEPLVRQAVSAGIPVVVYDLELSDSSGVVQTSQSDESMAKGVLDQLIKDVGDGAKVGYVSATGYAALDRRAAVWNQYVTDHKLDVLFSTGKVTDSTATDNIPLVDAALKQHPDVQAIFAPYDEIAKGTTQAVIQNGLQSKVKVYGIDISNADLQVITGTDSPWVATAATDPAAVGAAVVRATALKLAGQLGEDSVSFPATTFTQSFLEQNGIKNVEQLRAKQPDLLLGDTVTADWLPAVSQ